jgi:hypothetical protein
MEIKTTKKVVAVMMVIMLILCAGCFYRYGRCVYHCNPDNRLGFKAAYIRGDHITFKFDEEYALREAGFRTLKSVFESGEFPKGWSFWLITDTGEQVVKTTDNHLTVDTENMTISFDKNGVTANEVKGFSAIAGGDTWTVDFDKGTIWESHMGGEIEIFVIQHHDAKDDFWYPTETSEKYYPYTEV